MLILALVSFALAQTRCGRDFGGASCGDGLCCSAFGYCGETPDHCTTTGPDPCQSQCRTEDELKEVPKNRCGRDFGGASCGEGLCCSAFGYCGVTPDHCLKTGPNPCQSQCRTKDELDKLAPIITKCNEPNTIAVTYDDGPHPTRTRKIMKEFSERNLKTTFFWLGSLIEEHPDIVQEAEALGHQIANHSNMHQNFTTISDDEIIDSIETTNNAIEALIGKRPRFIRAPYGALNFRVQKVIGELGMQIASWNVEILDWEHKNSTLILEEYKESVAKDEQTHGLISVQHDIHEVSVTAAPDVINFLLDNNYQIVTLAECVGQEAYEEI